MGKNKNSDEEMLHSKLNIQFLKERRKKHLLQIMYNQKLRSPDLLDSRDKGIVLRGSTLC